MRTDSQYIWGYAPLIIIEEDLKRSRKFQTFRSYLENSDKAYVEGLMKTYLDEKKWIQNIKVNYKEDIKIIEDRVNHFHNSLKALAKLFKSHSKYEVTKEGLIFKKEKINLIWFFNKQKNQFLKDFENLLKIKKEFDNKKYSGKFFADLDYSVRFRPKNIDYISLYNFKPDLSDFIQSCMKIFSKIFYEDFKYFYLDGAGSKGTEKVFWDDLDQSGFFRFYIPSLNFKTHIDEIEKDEASFEEKVLPFLENRIRKFERDEHASSNFSYVYVLSNKSYPNTYKIGSTSGSPKQRAVDLSTTGVLHPFKVAFQIKIKNAEYYEFKIHKLLDNCRVKGNREFFELELDKIKDFLNQVLDISEGGDKKINYQTLKKRLKFNNPS